MTETGTAGGVAPHELLHELQRRLRNRPEIVEITRAEAPAQAVVLTGADADLTALPVHLQHGADGAPYISSSTDFVVDPGASVLTGKVTATINPNNYLNVRYGRNKNSQPYDASPTNAPTPA